MSAKDGGPAGSDTPRTDEAENDSMCWVTADFARTLERELSAARAEVEALKAELHAFEQRIRAEEREACARKADDFARKWWRIHSDSNKHMETTRKAHDDFCELGGAIRARSAAPAQERVQGECLLRFCRRLLAQGRDIWSDYQRKYASYGEYSARLDEAARERSEELTAMLSAAPAAPTEQNSGEVG